MKFIDEAKITITSGAGGRGCVSFRREKFVPHGGPNGGHGGHGGNVYFVADAQLGSLLDFRYKRLIKAGRGVHGMGKDMHGKRGTDERIHLPVGTVVKNFDTGDVLVDFTRDGEEYLCLEGGRGGKGNAHFKSSTNQAPKYAQPGEEGTELVVKLELKLLADVGIIGFPNAGKSTLISKISAAKPKVADYPFTTLRPNLGVVDAGGYRSFVVADIPGLVEGAHEGKGLGIKFLKHIERTAMLLHMIDLSPDTGRDPKEDYATIRGELKGFNPELSEKVEIVVLNKMDLGEAKEQSVELLKFFEDKGIKVFMVSAVTGEGTAELVNYLATEIERHKADEREG